MAWGRTREEDPLLKSYKEQIDRLERHIEKLESQNDTLIRALMSAKSPEAYNDLRSDEMSMREEDSISPDEKAKRNLMADTQAKFLEGLERPLFTDPHDFENYLNKKVGPPDPEDLQPESIHQNSES